MNNTITYLSCVLSILLFISCNADKDINAGKENHEAFSLSSALTDDSKKSVHGISRKNDGNYCLINGGNYYTGELLSLTDELVIENTQTLGDAFSIIANDIVLTTDGGVLTVGGIRESSATHQNAFAAKFNSSNTKKWDLVVEKPTANFIRRVVEIEGDFFGVGLIAEEEGLASTKNDILINRFDSEGNEIWTTSIEKEGNQSGWGIVGADQEGIIVLGFELGIIYSKIMIIKLDFDAEILWEKTIENVASESVAKMDLINTNDGGLIVLAADRSANTDILLIKLDNEGEEQWRKTYGGLRSDSARRIIQEENGDLLILGTTSSYGLGRQDVFLIKTDSNGEEIWSRSYGDQFFQYASDFVKRENGGYIICGSTVQSDNPNANDFHLLLIRVDEDGIPW